MYLIFLNIFFFPKTDPIELRDPCFHPGYNFTRTVQSVFNTPCMKAANIPNGNISHVGLGDWSQCQQSIRNVFNTSRCAYSQCSFNEVFQPSVDGKFGVSLDKFEWLCCKSKLVLRIMLFDFLGFFCFFLCDGLFESDQWFISYYKAEAGKILLYSMEKGEMVYLLSLKDVLKRLHFVGTGCLNVNLLDFYRL